MVYQLSCLAAIDIVLFFVRCALFLPAPQGALPAVVGWPTTFSNVSKRASMLLRTFAKHGEYYISFPTRMQLTLFCFCYGRSPSSSISGVYPCCLWVRLYLLQHLNVCLPAAVGWYSTSSSVSRRASLPLRTFAKHSEYHIGFPTRMQLTLFSFLLGALSFLQCLKARFPAVVRWHTTSSSVSRRASLRLRTFAKHSEYHIGFPTRMQLTLFSFCQGRPHIIKNDEGARTTHSLVAFTQHGETLIGLPTKRQAAVNSFMKQCSYPSS